MCGSSVIMIEAMNNAVYHTTHTMHLKYATHVRVGARLWAASRPAS